MVLLLRILNLCNLCHRLGNIEIHRTDPYTPSTADTALLLKPVGIYLELTAKAVSPPLRLVRSGIMTRCMESKVIKLTTIPVLDPLALVSIGLIDDIKAVACGAYEGAPTATNALGGQLFP